MSRGGVVLAAFAHPDDETFAAGALLAKLAAADVATHLLVATFGERGWKGTPRPAPEEIARRREAEVRAAAQVLGLRSLQLLGFADGGVAAAPTEQVVRAIARRIRAVTPDAVLTFGPDGLTGHPDHVAISHATAAAVAAAGSDPAYDMADAMFPPAGTASLWHVGMTPEQHRAYETLIGPLEWRGADPPVRPGPWQPWDVSGEVDTRAYAGVVRAAALCHPSQLRDAEALRAAPAMAWQAAFGRASLRLASARANGPDPIARLIAATPWVPEFDLPPMAPRRIPGVGSR